MNQHITELQLIYNVVGPYFLSDFYQPDGEKRLYEFLKSTYKPVFENNIRIVIVQDCHDEYDYHDMPGRAICTLQKYASQIDISNFFILVLSANTNIDNELDQARQLFSTDSVCISSQYLDELTYNKPVYKKQDTFCVLPWIHLYVGPDSNVLPCCVADRQHPMGSINDQSADSILKSSKFNHLRQNMLEGQRSKECDRCYQQEDSGLPSPRQKHNSIWKHRITDYNSNGSLDEFSPLYIDLRLNNICNLKCRMCSGYFSSAIAQEDLKLFKKSKNTNIVVEKESTLNEIFGYMATVEKIYFAGGEPLITNEHYKILHALIECNNTDVEIFYNTNFTSLEYKNILVTDLWKKFTNVTIGASLDGMGDVAEYVRHGSQWNNIEKNLKLLKSQCPHVGFTITSVAGCLNVSSLIELQKTWHENNIVDISKFSVSAMVGPDHLTLQILPEHHKTKLREKIILHIDWCRKNQADSLANQWENVLNYMMAKDCSYLLPEFRRITIALDQHRQESFLCTFPEFADLLK